MELLSTRLFSIPSINRFKLLDSSLVIFLTSSIPVFLTLLFKHFNVLLLHLNEDGTWEIKGSMIFNMLYILESDEFSI